MFETGLPEMDLVIDQAGDEITTLDRYFQGLLRKRNGWADFFNPIPADPKVAFDDFSPIDDPGFLKHDILHAAKDTGFSYLLSGRRP